MIKSTFILACLTTYVSYVLLYILRQPYSVTKSKLQNDGQLNSVLYNQDKSQILVGLLDSTFLFFYVIGSFINTPVLKRIGIIPSLLVCLITSSISCILYTWTIFTYPSLFINQMLMGLFQSMGWACCLSLIGKDMSAIKYGLWSTHYSLGAFIGKYITSSIIDHQGIRASYWLTGLSCIGFSLIILLPLFILLHIKKNTDQEHENTDKSKEIELLSTTNNQIKKDQPLSVLEIFKLDGVFLYSLFLCIMKFIFYTLSGWLPYYIQSLDYSTSDSVLISSMFDIGCVIGSILSGCLNDVNNKKKSNKRCLIASIMSFLFLLFYFLTSINLNVDMIAHMIMLLCIGICMNTFYILISYKMTVDLSNLYPSSREKIVNCVNGFASIGSVLQGLTVGIITLYISWYFIFCILSILNIFTVCILIYIYRKN